MIFMAIIQNLEIKCQIVNNQLRTMYIIFIQFFKSIYKKMYFYVIYLLYFHKKSTLNIRFNNDQCITFYD
ncbi:MAG TPA: hypothetical protein DIW31_08540 [Bacteroidales bacterium]|nr:hypothetical protein [Bacteroidales bacterium]